MDKKRILLIDDEIGFTQLLKLNLEKTGTYEVRVENTGARGAAVAAEFHPDLILLDIIRPDIDGGQVASQIKEQRGMRETPILFVTAIVSKKETMTCKNGLIGGHPFIAKPVDTDEVVESIEKTLSHRG